MSARHPDRLSAAVLAAEGNLQRLLERREAGLEGRGPSPSPAVIRAAEQALEAARSRLARAVAA